MKNIPPPVKLTLAWLWVAVPLGWGVYQSAIKSAPLFGIHPELPGAQPPASAPADDGATPESD